MKAEKNNVERRDCRMKEQLCVDVYDGHRHLFISDRAPAVCVRVSNLQRQTNRGEINSSRFIYYFGSQDIQKTKRKYKKILMTMHRITSADSRRGQNGAEEDEKIRCIADVRLYFLLILYIAQRRRAPSRCI